jgi:hypothetical protein
MAKAIERGHEQKRAGRFQYRALGKPRTPPVSRPDRTPVTWISGEVCRLRHAPGTAAAAMDSNQPLWR